ncbi:hypothetical protein C8J25_10761 [Sphingomonas faeni]|uniref:Uncharacterized protein n=1 Tax=Sphingomonas faeni TaxID=185950 RepID=A0A2T5U1K7_9SPHN|nr:hypothetical protein [Sphingomonas faeni]PTW45386.1 hypothetical protein C8J25_10761 [Sphingomonas faeni]
MTKYLNEVYRRHFDHNGTAYECLFFTDANEPHIISFEVFRDGRRLPFQTPGIGLTFVRFSVPFETEWDAKMTTGESAVDMLFDEARRMVEAQY